MHYVNNISNANIRCNIIIILLIICNILSNDINCEVYYHVHYCFFIFYFQIAIILTLLQLRKLQKWLYWFDKNDRAGLLRKFMDAKN